MSICRTPGHVAAHAAAHAQYFVILKQLVPVALLLLFNAASIHQARARAVLSDG